MSTTIESLELEIKSNSTKAVKGIDALTQSLAKLKEATKGGIGLSSVAKDMDKVSSSSKKAKTSFGGFKKTTQGVSDTNKKATSSFSELYNKMKAGITVVKSLGKAIWSAIDNSNDYIENVNLFNVAMGEYASGAMDYAESVSNAMGIDTSEWIRAQGVFMTLSTGFGVASDRANTMSRNLTQLGYDLSSFFNISTEDAMQKLQSGLSGELEPLRRLGYDLSQAKLEATAMALGIDKSVSSMTQAEKAQLRYYAIMTQVTSAQGDMARTLDDPANQLRVLKAEFSMATREIGNAFIPALNAILPYVIAVTRVIRTLASSIAGLFGYEAPEISDSMSQVAENTEAVSEGLQEGQEEAKKLKSYMLGFDELNVINPNEGSSAAVEDTSDEFDFELPEYDFMSGLVDSKVATIVEEMKEWLGLTGEITSWADLFNTNLGKILIGVGAIGVAFGLWKISSGIVDFVTKISTALPTLLTNLTTISGTMVAIAGFAVLIGSAADALINGIDWANFAGMLAGIAISVGGLAMVFGTAGAAVGLIVGGLVLVATGIKDALDGSKSLETALTIIVGILAVGAGIAILVTGWIPLIVAAIVAAVAMVFMYWEEIKMFFAGIWTWLYDNVFAPIGTFFAGVATWFYNTVIAPIIAFFAPLIEAIGGIFTLIGEKVTEIVSGVWAAIQSIVAKVGEIFMKIVEIFVALGTAFYDYVIKPIAEFIGNVAKWIYENAIKPVIDFFAGVGTWIYETIIEPAISKLLWLRDKAVEFFKAVGTTVVNFVSNLFKSIINGILGAIENFINMFIRMLNGAIDVINLIPGVSITPIALLSIPRLAEGAYGVPEGQMFIAREAGPEMVGSIGRKTTVANNDQIVEGIAGGVAEANSEQNALLREQNSLLRAILEKDSGVYLDGRSLTNSVEKYQRERGRVLITGGVV